MCLAVSYKNKQTTVVGIEKKETVSFRPGTSHALKCFVEIPEIQVPPYANKSYLGHDSKTTLD